MISKGARRKGGPNSNKLTKNTLRKTATIAYGTETPKFDEFEPHPHSGAPRNSIVHTTRTKTHIKRSRSGDTVSSLKKGGHVKSAAFREAEILNVEAEENGKTTIIDGRTYQKGGGQHVLDHASSGEEADGDGRSTEEDEAEQDEGTSRDDTEGNSSGARASQSILRRVRNHVPILPISIYLTIMTRLILSTIPERLLPIKWVGENLSEVCSKKKNVGRSTEM